MQLKDDVSKQAIRMIEPDFCTSMRCSGPPNKHCSECSHALFFGEGKDKNGKLWRWEFNLYHGPLFLRKDKEPLVNQPAREDHPAWKPFEAWYSKLQKRISASTASTGPVKSPASDA